MNPRTLMLLAGATAIVLVLGYFVTTPRGSKTQGNLQAKQGTSAGSSDGARAGSGTSAGSQAKMNKSGENSGSALGGISGGVEGGGTQVYSGPLEIGAYVFPGLRGRAAEVVALRFTQGEMVALVRRNAASAAVHEGEGRGEGVGEGGGEGGAKTKVDRDGERGWQVETLGGYPANLDRVRDTFRSLVDAKVLGQKTAISARYQAIGVEDPASAEATSVMLEALDMKGNVLAGLIVGNSTSAAGAAAGAAGGSGVGGGVGGEFARFVRRAGEAQSYVVSGRFPVDSRPTSWVDRTVLDLAGARIRKVEIRTQNSTSSASGVLLSEALVLSRASAKEAVFVVENAQGGRTVKDETELSRIGSALSFVTLEDVRRVKKDEAKDGVGDADKAIDFADATTYTMTTFDHVVIRARVVSIATGATGGKPASETATDAASDSVANPNSDSSQNDREWWVAFDAFVESEFLDPGVGGLATTRTLSTSLTTTGPALNEPALKEPALSAPAANAQGEISIDEPLPEVAGNELEGVGNKSGAGANLARVETDLVRIMAVEKASAEVAKLNARLTPWVFRVNAFKGKQLTPTMEDVLTPSPTHGPRLPVAAPSGTPASTSAKEPVMPVGVQPNLPTIPATSPAENLPTSPATNPATSPAASPEDQLLPPIVTKP